MVKFHPVGPGRPAAALTDQDGQFELTTVRSGDGALMGRYKVTILAARPGAMGNLSPTAKDFDPHEVAEAFEKRAAQPPGAGNPLVPAVYAKVESTPLEVQITGSMTIPLNLKD
jgi:hypothetical protein